MACPQCGISRNFQEFIPNDYGIELSEEIERKECPEPDCKSKKFSVFMARKRHSILSKFVPINRFDALSNYSDKK